MSTGAFTTARLVRNVAAGGAQQVLSMGVGFVLTSLLISRLGVEQYGVLVTAELLSIAGLLGNAEFGLQGAIVRFLAGFHVAGEHDRFRRLFVTGLMVFAGVGLLCGLAVLAFAHWAFFSAFPIPPAYREATGTVLVIFACTFPVQFAMVGLKAFYLSVNDFPRLKAWESLDRLLSLVAIAAALLAGGALVAVVVAEQVVSLGLAVLFAGVAARRYADFSLDARRFAPSSLRGVVALGLQSFGNHLQMNVVYQKAPEILVASILGPAPVGLLSTLLKVPNALKTLASSVTVALAPTAAAYEHLDQRAHVARLTLRGIRYSYFVLTPLLTFVAFFAPDLLQLWVGPAFLPVANVLRALVVWQYFMLFAHLLRATFTRVDQYRAVFVPTLAGNVVFLGLAVWLTVTRGDLWGVTIALVVAAVVTVGGYLRVLRPCTTLTVGDLWREAIRAPVLGLGVGAVAGWLLLAPLPGIAWWRLPVTFAVVAGALAWWVYRFELSTAERALVGRIAGRLTGRPS